MSSQENAWRLFIQILISYILPLSLPSIVFFIIISLLNKILFRGKISDITIFTLCILIFFLTIAAIYIHPNTLQFRAPRSDVILIE